MRNFIDVHKEPSLITVKSRYAETDSRSIQPTGTRAFTALRKAYRVLLTQSEESKKKLGLCESDFRVLQILLKDGPQPVNVLGAQIDLTTGSITTAIDRLESRWLVVRKLDSKDKRVRLVELTPKGRRVIERASAEHAQTMENAFHQLSRKDRLRFMKLLERITGSTNPL